MENRCVVCGEIIPEGMQVCASCMEKSLTKYEECTFRVKVNNVPRFNTTKYIVARISDGELWYWGRWNEKEKAERVAAEIGAIVVEMEDVYE